MEDEKFYQSLSEIGNAQDLSEIYDRENDFAEKLNEHREWLRNIRHERPSTLKHFRVAIYIRYFNQTKHENYLDYQIKQFQSTLELCPNWSLVGFYIDEGSTAPNMESAPEWSHLLRDCEEGKVDLIITQKVSNVSKKSYEIAFCARLLACLTPPVGIYFVSEDIYTTAHYYREDMCNTWFNKDIAPIEEWVLEQKESPSLLNRREGND